MTRGYLIQISEQLGTVILWKIGCIFHPSHQQLSLFFLILSNYSSQTKRHEVIAFSFIDTGITASVNIRIISWAHKNSVNENHGSSLSFIFPCFFFSGLFVGIFWSFFIGWGFLIIICIKEVSEKEVSTIVQKNIENLIFNLKLCSILNYRIKISQLKDKILSLTFLWRKTYKIQGFFVCFWELANPTEWKSTRVSLYYCSAGISQLIQFTCKAQYVSFCLQSWTGLSRS